MENPGEVCLKLREKLLNEHLCIYILEDIFGGLTKQFEKYIYDKIAQGHKKVLINLSDIKGIDNTAIGSIIHFWKTLSLKNGSLCIISNETIMEKFRNINLHKIIPFFDSEVEFFDSELNFAST
ncbi:MAG: STAS domain-containing protein [bacterium]